MKFLAFLNILVFWGLQSLATEIDCSTSLIEIRSYKEIHLSADYLTWNRRLLQADLEQTPFGISFGFYSFDPKKIPREERESLKFQATVPVSLRTFEFARKVEGKEILPPHIWQNKRALGLGNGLDPIENAYIAATETLRKAQKLGTQGPLFYFFMDDLTKGHQLLSLPGLNAAQVNSNYMLEILPAPGKIGRAVKAEGFTEGELRILLKEKKFLRRTQFILKGKVLNAQQVRQILGPTLNHFPYFDEVYKGE